MPSFISEDDIEQALIAKLQKKWSKKYNFETLNCFTAEAADLNPRRLATLGRLNADGQECPSYSSFRMGGYDC